MTTKEKVLGVVAFVATLLLGLVIGKYVLSSSKKEVSFGSVQTNATFATAPSVSNQGGLYLYDTDANSGLEVQGYAHFDSSSQAFFMGTTTFSGVVVGIATSSLNTLTVSGTSTFARLIEGGQVGSLSVATSTLNADTICSDSVILATPVSSTPTLTMPPTSTLFVAASGGCLTTNGQYIDVNYRSITTSTILAAGTGGTSINSSALTIAAGKGAVLRFIRDSATTYLMYVLNVLN